MPALRLRSTRTSARTTVAASRSKGVALGVILTIQLMMVLDGTVVNIALPEIQGALGFSATNLSWIVNAYTLAFGGLLLLGARAGDILGRRRVLIAGITVFTLASLIGGLAGSPDMLLIARTAQGVGAALASPSALALLITTFPAGLERARAIGYYSMVSIGGSALGLILGGVLVEWASWRWVFFVNVPIGVALVAVAGFVLAETPGHAGRFDLGGGLTCTLGMTALVYAFVRVPSDGWGDPITIAAFIAGIGLLIIFVLLERRVSSPLVPLGLLADRNRATSLVARLMLVAGSTGMMFFLGLYLQEVRGYSPAVTGLAFLPLMGSLMIAARLAPQLLKRLPARPVMVGGISAVAVGLLLLSRISASSSYSSLLTSMILCGAGSGLAFVPLSIVAIDGAPDRDAGAISGLLNTMQQVGSALGLAVLVTVFGAASNNASSIEGSAVQQAQHAFIVGANQVYLVAAAILIACAILVAVVIRAPARGAAIEAPPAMH